ncbi:SirB2 family protein [Paucibacter sp. APW11]|uniref:SirB2 family protein n=1 Tax=Roseateles aquae TaxID=3077235 RepID=A0ABU3P8G7_9BURK|nr:SirB2 family protein [Paucibacter sp. APW11]MDT8998036.1 SirB2 family protein [Paucibacter sp. APW11]
MSILIESLQAHYPLIKNVHIGLVSASGALFALRALAVQTGAAWPMQAWARRLSVVIDVGLLTAGASLWTLLGLNPLRDVWLGTKLALLLLYIVLGSIAMKRGRTRPQRLLGLLGALAVFGFMVTVARAHHPLGLLAG